MYSSGFSSLEFIISGNKIQTFANFPVTMPLQKLESNDTRILFGHEATCALLLVTTKSETPVTVTISIRTIKLWYAINEYVLSMGDSKIPLNLEEIKIMNKTSLGKSRARCGSQVSRERVDTDTERAFMGRKRRIEKAVS